MEKNKGKEGTVMVGKAILVRIFWKAFSDEKTLEHTDRKLRVCHEPESGKML